MSTYHFFNLYQLKNEDSIEVSALKTRYNRIASHLNKQWPILTVNERVEMSENLKGLEEEIRKQL
jgi:hypothetical protein